MSGADGETAASGGSAEELLKQVQELKTVLEDSSSTAEALLAAIAKLKACGEIPTKVLSATLIGKSVNSLAKNTADASVKAEAKDLVDFWRRAHRKRQGSADGQPPPKRSLSSTLSLGSEVNLSKDAQASQDSQPFSQNSQAAPLLRSDSLLSAGEESADAGQPAPYRTKVIEKLVEALGKAEAIEAKDGNADGGGSEMRDPVVLSHEIDEALHKKFTKKEDYVAQARSIIFNLKDKKNHTFKFKLMVGFFKAEEVANFTAEDMASEEKQDERKRQRKYAMEEIQSDWAMKNGQQRFTGMFTCGKCKGTKTTYFQMQTRSSDEPMTTFVSCVTCNNRWKFC